MNSNIYIYMKNNEGLYQALSLNCALSEQVEQSNLVVKSRVVVTIRRHYVSVWSEPAPADKPNII